MEGKMGFRRADRRAVRNIRNMIASGRLRARRGPKVRHAAATWRHDMITIVSERRPGGPKLEKPEALRGIKPFMSYKWGGSTTCQAFIQGDDIWISHHDWCSVVLYGTKKREGGRRFLYNDDFTAPALKGDAWIRLEGILKFSMACTAVREIDYECMPGASRFCADDRRMFEDVYLEAKELKDGACNRMVAALARQRRGREEP